MNGRRGKRNVNKTKKIKDRHRERETKKEGWQEKWFD